jgi:hypothetical protein
MPNRMEGRDRDSQRSKVYASERAAFKRQILDFEEIEAMLGLILGSSYFRRNFGTMKVTLQRGRNAGWANPWTRTISLGVYGRQRWLLLHELAHIIVNTSPTAAWHGWEFCEVYLNLIHRFLGKEAHDSLRAEFKARKVKFNKPRAKRQLTEEQRAELRERLARARARARRTAA